MAQAIARSSNRTRLFAVVAALALVWALTNAIGPNAQGAANVSTTRLGGNDRYETAKAIALGTFDEAEIALLARGDSFPDALAGNYVAGGGPGSPILLTPRDSLSPAALSAFQQLKTKTVVILGGTSAVSSAVETDLKNRGF